MLKNPLNGGKQRWERGPCAPTLTILKYPPRSSGYYPLESKTLPGRSGFSQHEKATRAQEASFGRPCATGLEMRPSPCFTEKSRENRRERRPAYNLRCLPATACHAIFFTAWKRNPTTLVLMSARRENRHLGCDAILPWFDIHHGCLRVR